jgi:hypothetical protein
MTDFGDGGERSQILARAAEEALAVRGTVMLEAANEARRWCAVCASVQGDLEVRVAEVAPATTLRRSLVVPGALPGTAAPPGEAAYPEHLAAALRGLVAAGDGSVHVECGRPARPLAWVWLADGVLIVEIEARDVPATDVELGRFPPSPDGAADAATALSERLERDFACAQPVPLFIGCLAAAPER